MRGRPVRPGTYTASVEAVDAAGNVSDPSVEVPVLVRYVELLEVPRRVRAGGLLRFRIDADAREVPILIQSTGGRAPPILVGRFEPGPAAIRIRRSYRPGRYLLMAGGHGRTFFRVVR